MHAGFESASKKVQLHCRLNGKLASDVNSSLRLAAVFEWPDYGAYRWAERERKRWEGAHDQELSIAFFLALTYGGLPVLISASGWMIEGIVKFINHANK